MRLFSILAMAVLLATMLVGCSPFSSFASQTTEIQREVIFRVYVCGAVQNEGYVEVYAGAVHSTLVSRAGYIPQTYLTTVQTAVTPQTKVLLLPYFEGEVYYPVNVNGALVQFRFEIENISQDVVNDIADYLENHGKITDKIQLLEILGEERYRQNFYKFFVSVDDYEKID